MSVKDDGGFAYPQTPAVGPSGDLYHPCQQGWGGGMSLRDYFAGQALAGMNASPALFEAVTSKEAGDGSHYERLSRHAYRQADAMLAERSK
jgi:hypothetical protein